MYYVKDKLTTQYITLADGSFVAEWQKLEGNFYPVNACRFCRYYDLSDQNTSLLHAIEKKKSPAVCINDSQKVEVYDRVKRELNEAFLKAFPKKSSFETDGAGEKH